MIIIFINDSCRAVSASALTFARDGLLFALRRRRAKRDFAYCRCYCFDEPARL